MRFVAKAGYGSERFSRVSKEIVAMVWEMSKAMMRLGHDFRERYITDWAFMQTYGCHVES